MFLFNSGKDYSGIDIVMADVNDEESLKSMCSQTRMVLNCVGPVCVKNFMNIFHPINKKFIALCI